MLRPHELQIAEHAPAAGCSLEEAQQYTRWLATHHYENFHVVSFLLPKGLHQDFYNVYSFCRWSDDLGDEMGDKSESLRLLGWWRGELHKMYAGEAVHPVLEAALGIRPEHLAYPVGDATSAGPREFRIAAELGFKTATTTRPGVLFKAHREHLTALPRISVNGEFQQQRYMKVLMSGAGTALLNRFRRVNAA